MTRWAGDPPRKPPPDPPDPNGVTDDPLAALGLDSRAKRSKGQVYAVSRVNPLFHSPPITSSKETASHPSPSNNNTRIPLGQRPSPSGRENSTCSELTRSPERGKSTTKTRLRHKKQESISNVYSPRTPRAKSPEIDYDDPLPRQTSGLSDYSEKLGANEYINNSFRQQSTSSGSSGGLHRQKSRSHRAKSGSSGYGGSNGGSSSDISNERLRLVEEAGAILEQNSAFVKSIRIAGRGLKTTKSVPSQHSASSGGGTLSTIPEGRVDLPVPQPIWPGPLDHRSLLNSYNYDSLVDEALLLYTSLSHQSNIPERQNKHETYLDISVKDLLLDLLASINQTLEGKTGSPEEMLKIVTEKIKMKLELLRNCTEEEMKQLCVNISNSRKVNSVLRAFSHSSSSGNSTSSGRARTNSSNEEDLYHIPSGSSSSGFSDSPPGQRRPSTPLLPQLYGRKPSILCHLHNDHEDSTLSRGIRNALIYGTLYRHKMPSPPKTTSQQSTTVTDPSNPNHPYSGKNAQNLTTVCENVEEKRDQKNSDETVKNVAIVVSDEFPNDSISCARSKLSCLKNISCDRNNFLVKGGKKTAGVPDKGLLGQRGDEKPSVWQLYYGVRAEGSKRYGEVKPTDVPVFPGGRPEIDFTLDVPRSELLSKRLREDKKWRFRCRLLTSFLGLVFFLLSVMGVSLVLTRGKRMFGSMV